MDNSNHMPLAGTLRSSDSPFIEAAAVDAWDAWFRWRDCGVLRDLTIDATWDRIAIALTSAESAATAPICKRRLTDALHTWRLLLDERILATAGTHEPKWNNGKLIAVLNAAAFVRSPLTAQARFDQTAFEAVAILAVRALDNALMVSGHHSAIRHGFQIGIIGFANALKLLGLAYDSVEARAQATLMAHALAQSCWRGSLQLARERGAHIPLTKDWHKKIHGLGLEPFDKAGSAIRHICLTAITSQQKLALLANNVADALDPINRAQVEPAAIRNEQRTTLTSNRSCVPHQLTLRAAMQNWIDEPIDYPLLVGAEPNEQDVAQWCALGTRLGLPKTGWRRSNQGADTSMHHPIAGTRRDG